MTDTQQNEPELTDDEVSEQKAVRLAKRERLIEEARRRGGAYPVAVPVTAHDPGRARASSATSQADDDHRRRRRHRRPRRAPAATPASCASPCCSPATERASRSWCRSPRSARSRSRAGRSSSTSATTSSSRARSSRAVAASCRSWSREWTIASKAILPLPNLHNELSEESRVRSRYLDLIARDQARANVVDRAEGRSRACAQTFADRGYIEVETPMLQVHARRRIRSPVRHPLERVRHRAVPAHRARAVPEARRRRRHRPRVRDQPQLPQRGRRLDALARSSRCSRRTRRTATTTRSPTSRRRSIQNAAHRRRGLARR